MIVSETSKRAHCCFVFALQILLPLPPIPCTVTPPSSLTPRRPSVPLQTAQRSLQTAQGLLRASPVIYDRIYCNWERAQKEEEEEMCVYRIQSSDKTNWRWEVYFKQFVIMQGEEEYPPVWMFGLYTNDKINVVIFRNIFSRTIPTMLNIMLHFWNVIVCYWTLPCNTRLPNCRQLQRLVACHLLFKEPRIHAICTFPFRQPNSW